MNKERLTVTAAPVEVFLGDVAANLAAATDAMRLASAYTPDIVVFPELLNTGFIKNAAQMHAMAEPADGPTVTTMRRLAAMHDCAVAGSYNALAGDGTYSNRGFIILPDGSASFYDKRHLFCLSKESEVFTPGTEPTLIVPFRGWNVALDVCYDLRFPEWMRNIGYAYDIMLLPANWSVARAYALEHLLIARAIENQAPIVCANLAGSDAYGSYDGCTFAFDCMGNPAFKPGTLTAEFSLDEIKKARSRMPCAFDADPFEISIRRS
ncbi:MAG: nitrilase family protein [Muribaculaceae bacterium]|nr:nitrilase family protein [Muribaculaceae bacterium]